MVAVGVIDGFEVVYVQNDDADGNLFQTALSQYGLALLIKSLFVEQAGQGIVVGQGIELLLGAPAQPNEKLTARAEAIPKETL